MKLLKLTILQMLELESEISSILDARTKSSKFFQCLSLTWVFFFFGQTNSAALKTNKTYSIRVDLEHA